MLVVAVALAVSAAPSIRITHAYTGKDARTIDQAVAVLEPALPGLLDAFQLAVEGGREVRLEPHADCAPSGLPLLPRPPHAAGTSVTVLNLCPSFFRRKPEEAAVVLGLEALYIAGLPDTRDGKGRRPDVSELSARIRWALRGDRKGGEASPHTRPVRPLWGLDGRLVRAASDRAARLLRRPECRSLLSDFVDAEGRLLAENLEPHAMPPEEYLARIALLDGSGLRLCETSRAMLFTTPKAQRIFVCRPFVEVARRQPYEAEVGLIHEMLHTLGLGENPPTSAEITLQVKRRCGDKEK
jgi:hypothetical protein